MYTIGNSNSADPNENEISQGNRDKERQLIINVSFPLIFLPLIVQKTGEKEL